MQLFVRNIGTLVTGELGVPALHDTSLLIDDGRITAIGAEAMAETVIDAQGCTVIPGLIDGHSHPTLGDYTPAQHTVGWPRAYLHGGVTTLISAGELHVPGLPLGTADAQTYLALARLAHTVFANADLGGVRMVGGTLLLTPGLTDADLQVVAEIGIRGAKFIFYNWDSAPAGEAEHYIDLLHRHNIWVKIHSGGVSRSGVSRVAGADIVLRVRPDIVGHIAGGPIPMPQADMQVVVQQTDCFLELASSGNPRMTLETVRYAREQGALERITVGTDTPGGTGILPRGMLRNLLFLASICDVDPVDAIAMATGNTARAHRLDTGVLAPGRPADFVLIDRIQGSVAHDALSAIALGDLPGISLVVINGRVVVGPRSEQTPPPVRVARVEGGSEDQAK